MECALELFTSRGYNGVGVQQVVEAAKVTKPTLYHYFGSKQGLLKAILEEGFASFIPRLADTALYRRDIVKNLADTGRLFFSFARNNPVFYRFVLSLSFSAPDSPEHELITKHNTKIYEIINKLFEDAVPDHGNMRGRSKAYAVSFIGTLNTYILVALDGHADLNEDLIYRAAHQFMHGIFS